MVATVVLAMAGRTLNAEQQAAVATIVKPLTFRIVFVASDPGCGKTTVIEHSTALLPPRMPRAVLASSACAAMRVNVGARNAHGMTIAMCISIWKSVQRHDSLPARIRVASGYDGLQDLLRIAMTGENPTVHARCFVDEFSMVSLDDMNMLFHIFRGMPNVVFVLTGDPEQLRGSSVPFHRSAELQALMKDGRVKTHKLVRNYRFEADPELNTLVTSFREGSDAPGLFSQLTPFMYRKQPSFDAAFRNGTPYPFIVAADNKTVNAENMKIVRAYVKSHGGEPLPICSYFYKEKDDDKGDEDSGQYVQQLWAAGVRGVMTRNTYTAEKELVTYNGQMFTVRSVRDAKELTSKDKTAIVAALDTGEDVHIDATKTKKGKWVLPARVGYVQTVHRCQGMEIPIETPYVVKVTPGMDKMSALVAISRVKVLDRFYLNIQATKSPSDALQCMLTVRTLDDGMSDFINDKKLDKQAPKAGTKRKAAERVNSCFTRKSRSTEDAVSPF